MPGVFSKSVGWILTVSKTVSKIANLGKRGVLFIWHDELGLRAVGSPAMVEKFNASRTCSGCVVKGSWEEAAKKDSINLATGNATLDIDTKASNSELIKQMTDDLVIGKLPCRLEFIATTEAIKWLEIELKKDFIEQGKKPVKKIPWGNPDYIPKCWAEDVWKWENINNPRHKQGNPPETGARLIDVLQATIAKRLREKNIDPVNHISESYTEAMDEKKRAARGIRVKTMSSTIEPSEENLQNEVNEVIPMDTESELENEVFDNNEVSGDHNNSISSEEGSNYDRDEDGRRKLPSRRIIDSTSSSLPEILPTDDRFSTTSIGDNPTSPLAPQPSSPPAQSSSPPGQSSPPARSLRSGATWTKGRGKGGKRMGIRGGLVNKDCLPPRGKAVIDAKRNRRNDWQEWVKNYKMQSERLIKKTKKGELKCPECEEMILKQSFLKHRTERGCINLDPKLKMGNWTLENFL